MGFLFYNKIIFKNNSNSLFIRPLYGAHSIKTIFKPNTDNNFTWFINKFPIAMLLIIFPVAFKYTTTRTCKSTYSMPYIVLPTSFISRPIRPSTLALSIFLSAFILSSNIFSFINSTKCLHSLQSWSLLPIIHRNIPSLIIWVDFVLFRNFGIDHSDLPSKLDLIPLLNLSCLNLLFFIKSSKLIVVVVIFFMLTCLNTTFALAWNYFRIYQNCSLWYFINQRCHWNISGVNSIFDIRLTGLRIHIYIYN